MNKRDKAKKIADDNPLVHIGSMISGIREEKRITQNE